MINSFRYIAIFLFFLPLPVLSLAGCQGSMTLTDAEQVALEFTDYGLETPPRSLGADLKSLMTRDVRGVGFDKCTKPVETTMDELLPENLSDDFLYDGRRFYALNNRVRSLFNRGEMGTVLQASRKLATLFDQRYEEAHQGLRARALATNAKVLAEHGDYFLAMGALGKAHMAASQIGRHRAQQKFLFEPMAYEIYDARAAAAMTNGDYSTAESNYRAALAYAEKQEKDLTKQRIKAATSVGKIEYIEVVNRIYSGSLGTQEAQIGLARALLAQGRLLEAESWAREALQAARDNLRPQGYIVLSETFYRQGRFDLAYETAKTALVVMDHLCWPRHSTRRLEAGLALIKSLATSGDWKGVRTRFELLDREIGGFYGTWKKSLEQDPNRIVALLMTGETRQALDRIGWIENGNLSGSGIGEYETAELMCLKAMGLSAIGKTNEAVSIFKQKMTPLLSEWQKQAPSFHGLSVKGCRIKLISETYLGILADLAAGKKKVPGMDDPAGEAFRIAGLLGAFGVSKSFQANAARSAVSDPGLSDIVRKMQDLERKYAARQALLAGSDNIDAKDAAELRRDLEKMRSAIATMESEIRSGYPQYTAITRPAPVGISEVRKYLSGDESFLLFFTGNRNTFIWAFQKQGPIAFHKAEIDNQQISAIVEKLRQALAPGNVRTLADIPQFDLNSGFELYRALLQPVKPGWSNAKRLQVVSSGALGRLPLAVLPTHMVKRNADGEQLFSRYQNVPWLGVEYSITQIPSVTSFVTLRNLSDPAPNRKPFIGFGDPWFNEQQAAMGQEEQHMASRGTWRASPRLRSLESADLSVLPRLPETADEVRSIAKALGGDPESDTFIGSEASEKTVKSLDMTDRKVLVFATHGLVPGDLDGLSQPALAMSSPFITNDRKNDGLLTMGEVMGLKLNADWVVLSACNTASGDERGTEAVSGLGQAFFYAGARSLLVTSWPVETISAKMLTTTIFQYQKSNPGTSRSEALQHAMVKVMNENGRGFSYAHPIFWAPFILVGDGG